MISFQNQNILQVPLKMKYNQDATLFRLRELQNKHVNNSEKIQGQEKNSKTVGHKKFKL